MENSSNQLTMWKTVDGFLKRSPSECTCLGVRDGSEMLCINSTMHIIIYLD